MIPVVAIPYLIAGGSAVVSSIATYFLFGRSSAASSAKPAEITTQGEIYNNVRVEEDGQNNTIILLISALLMIKIVEVCIYTKNALNRSLKKRIEAKQELTELRAVVTAQKAKRSSAESDN